MQSNLAYGELTATPIGPIFLLASERGVVRVSFVVQQNKLPTKEKRSGNLQAFQFVNQGLTEIDIFLKGNLVEGFSVPFDWQEISIFQRKVLEVTQQIKCGETRSYKDIANVVKASPRAVGTALANNPFLLMIPCHRVIGSDMKLRGYAAPEGIKTKEWLLTQEGLFVSHGRVVRNPVPRLLDI